MSEHPRSNALDLTQGAANLTRQLCDIPSVSGNEFEIADAIEHALHAHAPHLAVTRDGNTIVARTELGRSERVILAGHLDTVPVNENLPTHIAPDPVSGAMMLWGRGTVDMKAGVAVHLALAAELTSPAVDVTWVWYDQEEVDSSLSGLGRTIRNRPELFGADFAILGEPTNGVIEGGCNGTLRAHVTFTGKRAHSARSWMGVNAIHRAGAALCALETYEADEVEIDGLVYREGLNAVAVNGGIAGNVIPDLCTLTVNYRYAPSRAPEDAEEYVRTFFSAADGVEIVDNAPGALPGTETVPVQRFARAVGGEVQAKQGWTDVARFTALGMPAVNFGPGNPLLAHADDERVSPDDITRAEDALRRWLTGSPANQN